MRVVIVGASKIGIDFVKWSCDEGCDVVLIDTNPEKIRRVTDMYDCNGFVGNGASRLFLKSAGIDSASMIIAVTKEDETNLLCCHIAKELGVKKTIAVIRTPEFEDDIEYLSKDLGVDMMLNPDKSAANLFRKLARYSGAIDLNPFYESRVDVASIVVTDNSQLIGLTKNRAKELWCDNLKVCHIYRNNKLLKFDDKYIAKVGDRFFVGGPHEGFENALEKVGISEKIGKTVAVGGGKIGYFLLKFFTEMRRKITLVENDLNRCRQLIEEFPSAHIISGDGTDAEFIANCLKGADSCIAITGSDDKNLVISMFAKTIGIERITAEIQNNDYEMVLKKQGITHVFSKQDVINSGIIREERILSTGLNDSDDDAIKWMNILELGKVESFEFKITEDFKLCNVPVDSKEFKLKKGVSIVGVRRNGRTFIPKGEESLKSGDLMVVLTAGCKIKRLSDVLE